MSGTRTAFSLLPPECHEEFLTRLEKHPGNREHLSYLEEKSGKNMNDALRKEADLLSEELLKLIASP